MVRSPVYRYYGDTWRKQTGIPGPHTSRVRLWPGEGFSHGYPILTRTFDLWHLICSLLGCRNWIYRRGDNGIFGGGRHPPYRGRGSSLSDRNSSVSRMVRTWRLCAYSLKAHPGTTPKRLPLTLSGWAMLHHRQATSRRGGWMG